MYELIKFTHLAAGIVWLGGMAIMLWAVRPVAIAQLEPAQRLPLLAGMLRRFFNLVGLCVILLLTTGAIMLMGVDMKLAPKGWHAMSGLGLVMCAIFAHIWFFPFKRLKRSVALSDWPAAGRAMGQIHPLVLTNLGLGWVAVAAVLIWR